MAPPNSAASVLSGGDGGDGGDDDDGPPTPDADLILGGGVTTPSQSQSTASGEPSTTMAPSSNDLNSETAHDHFWEVRLRELFLARPGSGVIFAWASPQAGAMETSETSSEKN